MNQIDSSLGLKGDARRRAGDTIRGFLYQFWRTVEAWIELEPEEQLFVEGAEDFDRIYRDEATAAQVKDTRGSGPLTLGNHDAIDSLGNFWTLKRDNPARKIRFRFITTAEIGSEKGGVGGEKGIEMWDLCRRSPFSVCSQNVERIRDFLLSNQSINANLAEYLRNASLENIFRELIEPFEWLYNQPSLTDIADIVLGRLLKIGEPQGLTVTDAGRLAETLCITVAKAAVPKSPRPLTFIDFRQQLDRAVNVEIPREVLRNREVYAGILRNLLEEDPNSRDTELPQVREAAAERFAAPVLQGRIWVRRHLIERIRSALSSGVAYIYGSAGMGKTTVVRQTVEGERKLVWAGVRDCAIPEIAEICRALQHVAESYVNPLIVLDDLNPDGDLRSLENVLGRLAAIVRQSGGALVVIAYNAAGPRLTSVLGLANEALINVPPFEEEEIQQFLRSEGCPETYVKQLGRIVWLQTSGHPQLVAARMIALKTAAFPKPRSDEFIDQPKEIRDAREEALHVIRSVLPEPARNLLYRLSLAIPALKRSHALRIGAAEPSIPQAGEMFEYLAGPWLEAPRQERYRVSPLVSKAAEQVYTPEEIKELHCTIATALLAERSMTINEFSGIVVHALVGGAETQLAIAAKVFLTTRQEVKEAIAKELSWIAATGVDSSTHFQLSNKAVRQFFRLFQWEVAALAAPAYLEPLTKVMESDFAANPNQLLDVLPRILYLSELLLKPNSPISVDKVVSHMLEFWQLSEWTNTQKAEINIGRSIRAMHAGLKRSTFSDLFTVTLIPRVRTIEDLRTLISSLDVLKENDRELLLRGFKTDDGELRILFNRPWLSINRSDKQTYEEYAGVLEDARLAGRRWKHHAWMRAATRTLSAILDEMLDRRDDAEQIVVETTKEIEGSPNLEDQLAIIAFNRKEYGKALQIWQRVLPRWTADKKFHDMQPYFGTRCAAIAAAMIGKWDLAADLFRQALKRSANFSIGPQKIGLLADLSYALWNGGDRKQAVRVLSECVQGLEKLPNKPESFAEYAVQKLVGCAFGFLATHGEGMTTPIPGMCSNPSPHEGIKELPPSPTVCLWFLVHTLAKEAGDDRLAARSVEKFRDAPFSFLQAMAAKDSLERCLKSRRLKAVVTLVTQFAFGMERTIRRESTPPYMPDPPGLTAQLTERSLNTYIRPALWAGILRAKALEYNVTSVVEAWQHESDPVSPYISDQLVLCHTFSAWTASKLATVLRDKDETHERRLLATLLLLGNEDASPMDALYAQVMLITAAKNYDLFWDTAGDSFDFIIRRDWCRFIGNRFLLSNPSLHIGPISEACGSKKRGWSAAANIILVASPTVNLTIPAPMWQKIRDLGAQSSSG